MNKMMDALNAGKLERIVVWRLDRLGRTCKGLCALFDELRERKVDLVSLRDGFSLNSPAGRLHARILASVAEYETEVRAERVRAGQAAARAKGKTWGGSKPGRFFKVTPEQIDAIRKMVDEGQKISRIARITGLVAADGVPGAQSHGGGVARHGSPNDPPPPKPLTLRGDAVSPRGIRFPISHARPRVLVSLAKDRRLLTGVSMRILPNNIVP